jgi:hypothetical protein
MRVEHSTIRIAPSLHFATPDGATVSVRHVRAHISYRGSEHLVDLSISFAVDGPTWQRIDANGWFNLAKKQRGPCFGGPFDLSKDIEIDARLASDDQLLLSLSTNDLWEVGGQIRGATLNPALHETETWLALYVKQQQGPIKGGFATTHAD